MTYRLFLDDERIPADVTWITLPAGPWEIVRTQDAFQKVILGQGIPDHISFDNDLGEGCGEGRYCAQWLIDAVLDGEVAFHPFTFTVHSMNNVAKEAICSKLSQFLQYMDQKDET